MSVIHVAGTKGKVWSPASGPVLSCNGLKASTSHPRGRHARSATASCGVRATRRACTRPRTSLISESASGSAGEPKKGCRVSAALRCALTRSGPVGLCSALVSKELFAEAFWHCYERLKARRRLGTAFASAPHAVAPSQPRKQTPARTSGLVNGRPLSPFPLPGARLASRGRRASRLPAVFLLPHAHRAAHLLFAEGARQGRRFAFPRLQKTHDDDFGSLGASHSGPRMRRWTSWSSRWASAAASTPPTPCPAPSSAASRRSATTTWRSWATPSPSSPARRRAS